MLVSSSTSLVERVFLSLYLRIPFPSRDRGYHIDVYKYILLNLHSITDLIDSSFRTDIDDRIRSLYDPLRHYIANDLINDEHDEQPDKTISIFRLAKQYTTIKSVRETVFLGVTRPVRVLSDTDMSLLYYDVLQRKSAAVADHTTTSKIINGEISIIALSYRHLKDDQRHLGITKREFIAATRALHLEAQEANPPEEYCFWWDSCLQCSPKYNNKATTWAAVGLTPYAFCHVLSIRREYHPGDQDDRLWIDYERALARLSKGLTAVKISREKQSKRLTAEFIGNASGSQCDPEWALSQGLLYGISGDSFESAVTFPEDKVSLNRAGILVACNVLGTGVHRALFDVSRTEIRWVSSWAGLERNAFLSALTVRLGEHRISDGGGEEYLDNCVKVAGEKFAFDDRRSWLPNSSIYEIEAGDAELPNHVKDQIALLVQNTDNKDRDNIADNMFGLLLYYEQGNEYNAEAVHGCVVNLLSGSELLIGESISRLHVPRSSRSFAGFVHLYQSTKWPLKDGDSSTQSEMIRNALAWLWEENEMQGDKENVIYEVV